MGWEEGGKSTGWAGGENFGQGGVAEVVRSPPEGEVGFSLFKFRQCRDAICEVVSSENECIRLHVRYIRERQSLDILSP